MLLTQGMRHGLRVKTTDHGEHPTTFIEGHANQPPHKLLPVTRVNRLNRFTSHGVLPKLTPSH